MSFGFLDKAGGESSPATALGETLLKIGLPGHSGAFSDEAQDAAERPSRRRPHSALSRRNIYDSAHYG